MKKMIKRIVGGLLLLIFAVIAVVVSIGYKEYKNALINKPLSEAAAEIQEKESFTALNELPKSYLDAVISVEDHRFYYHSGINPIAIARAIKNDILTLSLAEGGSTITQQLAKNIYFSNEKSFIRKIAEMFMAVHIEKTLDKSKILELYVNTIYFGSGYYSVKEAAVGYFKVLPRYMTDYQCAMLAGIPNAPSVYSPDANPELAEKRTKQVLKQMVKYGYISQSEKELTENTVGCAA